MVTTENQPPRLVAEVDDVHLVRSGTSYTSQTLDLSRVFRDMDGDSLTYTAKQVDDTAERIASLEAEITKLTLLGRIAEAAFLQLALDDIRSSSGSASTSITVSLSGAIVTFGATGPGVVDVIVTASDGQGGSASETFDVFAPDPADLEDLAQGKGRIRCGTEPDSRLLEVAEGGTLTCLVRYDKAHSIYVVPVSGTAGTNLDFPGSDAECRGAGADLYVEGASFEKGSGDACTLSRTADGEGSDGLSLTVHAPVNGRADGERAFRVEIRSSDGATVLAPSPAIMIIDPGLSYEVPGSLQVKIPARVLPTRVGFSSPIGYAVTTGTLPPGLAIDASTGVISGIPTTANANTVTVTVTATAGTGSTLQTATADVVLPAVEAEATVAALVLSETSLTVHEGTNDTYTLRLATRPTANVTVAVAVTGSSDVTAAPSSLIFARSDWNVVREFVVWAAEDTDGVDDTATVSHTASGGGYDSLTASMAVTVDDDDATAMGTKLAIPTVTLVRGDAQLTANWAAVANADTYALQWKASSITSWTAATGVTTVDPATPGTVITGLTNGLAYDVRVRSKAGAGSTTHVDGDWSSAIQGTPAANRAPTVANAMSDQAATVDTAFSYVFAANTFADADGDSLTYTAMRTDGTTDSALPSWLTFTAGERKLAGTPRTADIGTLSVKVTASDGTASISDTFDIVVSALATPGLTLSPTSLTVNEGATGTYTVKLATQPTANVTVSVAVTGSSDVTVSPASLTFTSSNWDTTQTVTVSAAQDGDAVDDTATLNHTASGGGYGSVTGSVSVTVNDDDTSGLTLSPSTLTVNEGATGTYTARLATQPTANVTVAVAVTGSSDVTVSPASLTFTNSNWDTTQTVTVSAAQDGDAVDDTATLNHTASGGGYGSVTGTVSVTVNDDDTPGLTLSPSTLTVDEGATGTYTARLATQPTANVTVAVAVTGSSDVTVSPASLTFTRSNWDGLQRVTVSGAQDGDAVDDTATLSHTASGGDYGSVTGTVSVTVDDDDTRGVTLSRAVLTVLEGSTGTYTVVLTTQPTGRVTVTPTVPAGTDVSVSPASLSFTSTSWSTAQTVTVTAGVDVDAVSDPVVTLTHAVTGADYGSVTAGSVAVTITEKDVATFGLIGPTTVAEDAGKATYAISLSVRPGASVTVDYATSDGTATAGSDYVAQSGTLTFTPTRWNTAQTVDVAITDDSVDEGDEIFTFTLSNAGTGSALSSSPSVRTTITDDDEKPILATAQGLAVKPGTLKLTAFTVTWDAVAHATGYTATTLVGGVEVSGTVTVPSTGPQAVFTGLTSGTIYVVKVKATGNAVYRDSAVATLEVLVHGDTAPRFEEGTGIFDQAWTVGTDVDLSLPEAFGRNGVLSYALTPALPAGVALDAVTRTLSGAPTVPLAATTYTWRVSDDDENTANADTAALTFRIEVSLAAPTPTVTQAGNAALTLSWDAPNGSVATDYDLRYREGSHGPWMIWQENVVGTARTATVTGLKNGQAYQLQVRAKTADAAGPWSPSLSGTPVGRPAVIGARLVASQFDSAPYAGGPYAAGDTIWLSLEFNAYVDYPRGEPPRPSLALQIGERTRQADARGALGDRIVFAYRVVQADRGTLSVPANALVDNGNTIYRRGGGVHVRADQAVMTHDAVALGHSVEGPSAIAGLEASTVDGLLTVRWDAAADAPGGYLVRWRERRSGSSLSAGETQSGTSYTIRGLTNGQAYVVRVDKLDANGRVMRGTNSAVVGTPTADTAPTRVTGLEVTAGDGSLSVRWTAASRAPSGYSVRWREQRPDSHLGPVNTITGTSYTISGLTNATTYIVRVDTRNAADDGVERGTHVTVAGTPRAVSASMGRPTVDVHDAQGDEGDPLAFRITLSHAVAHTVTVRWRTGAGTAQAGADFASASGTATFEPGETAHTVEVRSLDDAHNDPGETFRVVLSDVQGAVVGDGEAVGTIRNRDVLPGAWLAHFGRAAAEQALDGVTERLAAPRTPGMQGMVAGLSIGDFVGGVGDVGDGGAWSLEEPSPGEERTITIAEALTTSRFTLIGKRDEAGANMALWGRGAQSHFDARAGAADLDGTLVTGMLGADYGGEDWLGGVALAWSDGEGGYREPGAGSGDVEGSLRAMIPYGSLRASDRLGLWGAAGIGSGTMTLAPEDAMVTEADLDWRMAAAGLRGDLSTPRGGQGLTLALVSDLLWTQTDSARVARSGLAASESEATRLRLGLEGHWSVPLEAGGSIAPRVEVGVRRDGGDAGEGLGIELGGGMAWAVPRIGFSLDLAGRTLLAHESDGRREHGFSATVGYDPRPESTRGLSLSVRQETGGRAEGGLDALLASGPLDGGHGGHGSLGAGAAGLPSRWAAEAAYGLAVFGGFTASPTVGVGLSGSVQDYSFGWRLAPAADPLALSLGVKATRRHSDGTVPVHGIGFEFGARW